MNSYRILDLADLAAWRETLMIHARGFIFSQRRGGRKEFLRNGGLGGLARDFNDSRTRIYFLAKARRTQGIPTECWTWRLGGLARDNSGNSFFCSRKGAEDAKEFLRNVGLGGLGGLARDNSGKRFSCGIKEGLKT